jgi:hypothetical protein
MRGCEKGLPRVGDWDSRRDEPMVAEKGPKWVAWWAASWVDLKVAEKGLL